ncbi:MAG: thioesterase family protein [Saprospiraceae bacterium]
MSKKEFSHSIVVRSRYSETDQMGFIYYGRFAEYYEIGRVETIRTLGLSYKDLELNDRILMPVISLQVRYIRPATYDQNLEIKTILRSLPQDVITFYTEIRSDSKALLNAATVRLCFLNADSKQRVTCPTKLRELIAHAIEISTIN